MKINHKVIIGILKTITVAGFFVAISIKLYNVYKYGGTTKPSTPSADNDIDNDIDNDNGDYESETEVIDKYPVPINEPD